MTTDDENIVYDYFDKFPDSLTMRQIDIESDLQMDRIVPLMKKALLNDEPLTDAIFNIPDGADY